MSKEQSLLSRLHVNSPEITREEEVDDLREIFSALQHHNSELNSMIGLLNEENVELNKINKGLREITPYIRAQYPPYLLSEILGISSRTVTKIAEEIGIFSDKDKAIRITREKSESPEKYETTVLFSIYGIATIYEKLYDMHQNPGRYKGLCKIIGKEMKEIEKTLFTEEKIIEKSLKKLNNRYGKVLEKLAK